MSWRYRLGQAIGATLLLLVGPVVLGTAIGIALAAMYHVLMWLT